jgi:UDP-3-O-[3-hydroxymyristoyl] N-acetylglucosamine deacetylase
MGRVELQHTLAREAICAGIALHSGQKVRVVLRPAPVGHGIVFVRTDAPVTGECVAASALAVSDTRLCTRLTNANGVSFATVEHLMAACAGLGVDNLIVDIDAEELPILDGASAMWCQLILQAGVVAQAAPRRFIKVLKSVEVRDGAKVARLLPGEGMSLHVGIDYADQAIGRQWADFTLEPGSFVAELAFARTFGFLSEVEYLRANGLARGGSMDNAIVVDRGEVLNPGGLHTADEFVRHKVLDAIGDLALAGGPIEGRYEADRTGHALNNALVRALLSDPTAWAWSTTDVDVQADATMDPGSMRAWQGSDVRSHTPRSASVI